MRSGNEAGGGASPDCSFGYAGGTNDVLAQQLGLVGAVPLERSTQSQDHKLVVFVPNESIDKVLKVPLCHWRC